MLSRFHPILGRYGRTDGQTDLLYQYRASVCWCTIKIELCVAFHFDITISGWTERRGEVLDAPSCGENVINMQVCKCLCVSLCVDVCRQWRPVSQRGTREIFCRCRQCYTVRWVTALCWQVDISTCLLTYLPVGRQIDICTCLLTGGHIYLSADISTCQ